MECFDFGVGRPALDRVGAAVVDALDLVWRERGGRDVHKDVPEVWIIRSRERYTEHLEWWVDAGVRDLLDALAQTVQRYRV